MVNNFNPEWQMLSTGERLSQVDKLIGETRDKLKHYEQQRELLLQLFLSEKGHLIKPHEDWFIKDNKVEVWFEDDDYNSSWTRHKVTEYEI
jgi:hypothetical protein